MSLEVGLKDVALRAGVSPATASNALSGARPVAEATRLRVFQVAEAMNYHPNLVARGLRRQETRTIALLVADIANPYYPAVARAIHDRISDHGYVSFIGNTDGDAEVEIRLLEEMRARNVDGIIMSTMALTPERTRSVIGPAMPLVLITGARVETPEHEIGTLRSDEIGTADAIGIGEAVNHLRDKGVMGIGYISGPDESVPGASRLQNFRVAMEAAGLRVNEAWIDYAAGYTVETGYDAAERLLSRTSRPAAIMCANDLIAIGVLEAARDHRLTIPIDLAVVGFDDIPTAKHVSPKLTTIINPAALVGYACAKALMHRIEHPEAPFEHRALPTHLIVRGTA